MTNQATKEKPTSQRLQPIQRRSFTSCSCICLFKIYFRLNIPIGLLPWGFQPQFCVSVCISEPVLCSFLRVFNMYLLCIDLLMTFQQYLAKDTNYRTRNVIFLVSLLVHIPVFSRELFLSLLPIQNDSWQDSVDNTTKRKLVTRASLHRDADHRSQRSSDPISEVLQSLSHPSMKRINNYKKKHAKYTFTCG